MQWLHNLMWLFGVLAVFCLLGAGYVNDVRGNSTVAGILLLIALVLGAQVFRMRGWIRRLENAKSE